MAKTITKNQNKSTKTPAKTTIKIPVKTTNPLIKTSSKGSHQNQNRDVKMSKTIIVKLWYRPLRGRYLMFSSGALE